jgi:hypothetical protein
LFAEPSGTIAADGSLVLKLYYWQKEVTLTFYDNVGSEDERYYSNYYQYYGDFLYPSPNYGMEGYVFTGWSPVFMGVAPAENATYTAQWTPNISEAIDVSTSVYASQDYTAAGVYWDYANKTLTLTNAAIIAADGADDGSDNSALRVPDGTTIILIGNNYISSGIIGKCYGILCDGNLTIQGPGMLTALGATAADNRLTAHDCYGIYATGTVTIENNASVIACGGNDWTLGDYVGIYAQNVVITDSSVLTECGSLSDDITCGIYASDDIEITNSTVNTPSSIYACGDVTISQSTVNVQNPNIAADVFSRHGIHGDNVKIEGGTVYVTAGDHLGYGIYAETGVEITGDAKVTALVNHFGDGSDESDDSVISSGIYAGTGSIRIKGSTVIARAWGTQAMNKAPVLEDAVVIRASENDDGSVDVDDDYDTDDIGTYKYIQIRAD